MLYYLAIGALLGLTAGLSPGPLLALLVSETLKHGIRSGAKVALAPLLTDLPIVLIVLFASTQLSSIDRLLGIISLIGACYVVYMGYQNIRQKPRKENKHEKASRSLKKGVLVNALSPHPYLFWFTVGAPLLMKAMDLNFVAPALFIGGFYTMLVGAKLFLALLAGSSKLLLSGKGYIYTMRLLGLALVLFSVVLFADGLTLLGVLNT